MSETQWEWLEKAVEELAERIDRFSDIPQEAAVLFEFSPLDMKQEINKESNLECAVNVIRLFGKKIATVKDFDYSTFAEMAKEIREETGCKGKDLFHPLRIVLTAKGSGLDLDKFIPLVEEGAKQNFPVPVKNCAQRVSEALKMLE